MNRVLFNGHTGGLGRYFADALRDQSLPHSVLSSRLEDSVGLAAELDRITLAPNDSVTLVPLAGLVPVVMCEKEPERAFKTNVTDTLALVSTFLGWARRHGARPRVLYVSTGHVYAPQPSGRRTVETDPVLPRSVYARTKLQAEDALRDLFKNQPDDLIIARVFGLLSPDQSVPYVLPSLVRRCREKNFANMGGLDCVRDYLDARDVCRALAILSKQPWHNLALPANRAVNICSGEGVTIRALFDEVRRSVGVSDRDMETMTVAPARPDDIASIVGDPSVLARLVPTPLRSIALRRTVQDTLHTIKP